MSKKIGIIEYGMGNIQSVRNACERLGHQPIYVSDPNSIDQYDALILPGVGSFSQGIKNLKSRNLFQALQKTAKHTPLLGICLGMQLLADFGEEGGHTPGLGLIPGEVIHLPTSDLRIPHVGWNNLYIQEHPLFHSIQNLDYYFVHSYYFNAKNKTEVLAECEYGVRFPCVVGNESGNIFGVQFHPEKSHQTGLKLLKNFFDLIC